ncbi:hypothetical protein [Herpetosiphon sp. NSE202]|uniref:hypothetical protein n=1 Tax=Herpetosiphon sp. NSE202 TaxID=3351349 RepID=UPI00362F45C2
MKHLLKCMIVVVLCSCGSTVSNMDIATINPVTSNNQVTAEEVLEDFRRDGFNPQLSGNSSVQWLNTAPGAAYSLGTGWLHIHTYASIDDATAAAKMIPPTADTGQTDWIADPHFFQCKNIIVLYLGAEDSVLNLLMTRCGLAFASRP